MPIVQKDFSESILMLQEACDALGVKNDSEKEAQLKTYLELLLKWNEVYNLTAIFEPREIMIKHVFDSLSILSELPAGRVADVGTGAGFPGIPLAIYSGNPFFELIDSNGKKTRFLQSVIAHLKLTQVQIQCTRVEQWHPTLRYDVVMARAFAPLDQIMKKTEHLLTEKGQWLLMSGKIREDEIENLQRSEWQVNVIPLTVPFLEAERHLVKIQRKT